jgi:hypothetical protein
MCVEEGSGSFWAGELDVDVLIGDNELKGGMMSGG